MPIPVPRLRGALLLTAAAISLSLTLTSAAAAKSVPVDLRVIGPAGQNLADHVQYTGTTKIKTDRKAD